MIIIRQSLEPRIHIYFLYNSAFGHLRRFLSASSDSLSLEMSQYISHLRSKLVVILLEQ